MVAAGDTEVEPLPEVDVNPPGLIAMLVAPLAAHVNVLLDPELMLAGLAEKELIDGGGGGEVFAPPADPAQPTMLHSDRIMAISRAKEGVAAPPRAKRKPKVRRIMLKCSEQTIRFGTA